jgi:hypothetical protein
MDSYETEDEEIEEIEIETGIIKKKEDLLNKLLNKSFIIISFSVKPEYAPLIKEFDEIVKREKGLRGRSEVILKLIADYVKAHRVGNPQLLLTHYTKPEEEPQPIRVLCVYCDGALSEGKVFCQKRGMWIPSVTCYSCKDNRLRKKEGDAWIRGKWP